MANGNDKLLVAQDIAERNTTFRIESSVVTERPLAAALTPKAKE